VALGRHLEDAEPGAGVEPAVPVGKGRERLDGLALAPEVPAVLEVGTTHLHARLAARGLVGDRRRRDRLGEEPLVLLDLRRELSHVRTRCPTDMSPPVGFVPAPTRPTTYKRFACVVFIMTGNTAEHQRMIIAGSGIAGLSAAIYAGRANNDPLVFEGDEPGGQLTLTTDVANYPGFPEGIGGPELIQRMKDQAATFGAEFVNDIVADVERRGEEIRVETEAGDAYSTDAFVAASGASARTLGVPGEDELLGYGVSTCATCDGAFFRGEDMLVVGGGDAAMEEATFLTKFADTVYIAHRRENFRAEQYWVDRVLKKQADGEIEIMRNTELLEVHGSPEDGVDHVTLARNESGYPKEALEDAETERFEMDVGAVFLAIGHTPNTGYFEGTDVETDEAGYVITEGGDGGGQTRTGVEGIFAAGDVVDHHYQQAATAGGDGTKAAMDANDYLEDVPERETAAEADPARAESDD